MRPLRVTESQIGETLTHLRAAGRSRCECVVLWLGRDQGDFVLVDRVYRPEQVAYSDLFRIEPHSMDAILEILGSDGLMIAAQVHSHPREAFHSRADDQWAIVRHVDALSLVVPDFALRTDSRSFLDHMKAYQLTPANRWHELSAIEARQWLEVR